MAEKLRLGRGIAEFTVVVLGVMAALAGDNWREARQDSQTERVYLSRLAGEVEEGLGVRRHEGPG